MKKLFHFRIRSRLLNILLAVVLPVMTLCLVEYYTHVPGDLTPIIFLVNLLAYYIIYLFFVFLTGRLNRGYCIATLFFLLFGLLNYVVMAFRSTPVVPWDIYSLKTAASVAGNYKLELNQHFFVSFAGLILVMLMGSILDNRKRKAGTCIGGIAISAACLFIYIMGISSPAVIDYVKLDTILFTPKVLYRNNGLTTGFLGVLKYLKVEKPDHYSDKYVTELTASYEMKEDEITDRPNIIVIMNEAFSDLSVYGELNTSEDYMPFIHSLDENIWKGNCYVSVKGGNTANSEYEFLTGNSMAFVPGGSVPYQQYIKSEIPSLASHLKSIGYRTAALHPYNADGWNRNTVYPDLGFEEEYFKDSFSSAEKLRGYVTDQSAFEKIIELYEEKEDKTPLFAFEVTMQNHGGYSKEYTDLSEELFLTDLPDKTTQIKAVEKYLSLIRRTDQAFENLVDYFKNQKEKTIVLMFGDHQPSDYITNVIARLQGCEPTDSRMQELSYIVPYIMWSNYDVGEQEEDTLSLNYLNLLLMEMADLPLTGYQMFEKDMYASYHVITANQLLDGEDREVEMNLNLEKLNEYACLSYNLLCDKKNKKWDFFQ